MQKSSREDTQLHLMHNIQAEGCSTSFRPCRHSESPQKNLSFPCSSDCFVAMIASIPIKVIRLLWEYFSHASFKDVTMTKAHA